MIQQISPNIKVYLVKGENESGKKWSKGKPSMELGLEWLGDSPRTAQFIITIVRYLQSNSVATVLSNRRYGGIELGSLVLAPRGWMP